MSEAILLVNPRRRKRRKNARRARARVSRRRRRNPIGMLANPRRRRRHRAGGYRVRRRRRNPRGMRMGGIPSVRGIIGQLIPAATGAVGAVGLDVALAYLPIPESFKTGWGATAVKIVGAVALGWLAGKAVGKSRGHLFTAGALTVVAYQVIRNAAAGAIGDKVKGLSGVADFDDLNLGAYMRPALSGPSQMGAYMNPAPYLNGELAGIDGMSGHEQF